MLLPLCYSEEREQQVLYAPPELVDLMNDQGMDLTTLVLDCARDVLRGSGQTIETVTEQDSLLVESKSYELKLVGSHFDHNKVESIKAGIHSAYSEKYPGQ